MGVWRNEKCFLSNYRNWKKLFLQLYSRAEPSMAKHLKWSSSTKHTVWMTLKDQSNLMNQPFLAFAPPTMRLLLGTGDRPHPSSGVSKRPLISDRTSPKFYTIQFHESKKKSQLLNISIVLSRHWPWPLICDAPARNSITTKIILSYELGVQTEWLEFCYRLTTHPRTTFYLHIIWNWDRKI